MLTLLNTQYFYMAGLSCLGAVIFFKRNMKIGIALFSILFLCIVWRGFSFYSSSRYYAIFLLYGLFFSACAADYLIQVFRKPAVRKGIFLFLLAALLGCHTAKMFSSFQNNYFLDLQDDAKRTIANDPDDIVYIYNKEFTRLKGQKADDHLRLLSYSDDYDINEIFLKKCHYTNKAYFVVPESNSNPATPPGDKSFKAGRLCRTKVEQHFTNTKHTKTISMYKFRFDSVPAPEVDLSSAYDNPILKAYIPEYDTFIYQVKNKLVWLIGADIETDTEIIYQQLTDRPDLLPPNRVEYCFDNRGFHASSKSGGKRVGRYLVIEKDIPTEYPITEIRAGFSGNGVKYWRIFCLTPF